MKADLTYCDLRRDPGACFVAFHAWQRQLQVVVHPVGFGFIQLLQLVADLSQQVFPPRNVGVGFVKDPAGVAALPLAKRERKDFV